MEVFLNQIQVHYQVLHAQEKVQEVLLKMEIFHGLIYMITMLVHKEMVLMDGKFITSQNSEEIFYIALQNKWLLVILHQKVQK